MKYLRSCALLCLLAGVAVMGAGPSPLQDRGTGSIEITVTDSAGTPVPDVNVILERSARAAAGVGGAPEAPAGGSVRTGQPEWRNLQVELVAQARTDPNGVVTFRELPAGRYRAVVRASPAGRGFVGVQLADGRNETRTLRLTQ